MAYAELYSAAVARVGIVDLGSNTARLVVFDFEPGRWFVLADEIRERVRLGQGLGTDGQVPPEALGRALAALDLFSDYAATTGLEEMKIIATSAVRDAKNRGELLERIGALGLEVDSVSGEEEARLGVIAVANGFDLDEAWVIDLGGGSAQVSRMSRRLYRHGRALPLGALRLTDAYLASDPPRRKEVKKLEKFARAQLESPIERMAEDEAPLVAMGGTIRNLARAAQKRRRYPLDLMHNYFLSRDDLERVTTTLLERSARKRGAVSGISGDRADIILAGALVFRLLLRASGREGLWISGNGVREGAFFKHFLPAPHLLPGVRRFSVENLAHQFGQHGPHLERVRRLARRVFEELESLHGYGSVEAELLDAAATVHDIGMDIGYHLHHKHGSYLVLTARLNGFDHREQALLARLVRYHRKGQPKLGAIAELTREGDGELLGALSFCLRLAEMLERSRAGRVEDVTARIGRRVVRLDVLAAEEPAVELWEAGKQAPLFERVFERELRLRWAKTDGGTGAQVAG